MARLSDILSSDLSVDFQQVDGFIVGKKLIAGTQKDLSIGRIALNYYCKNCNNARSFFSSDKLYCIVVNQNIISIDCVLHCPTCDEPIQVWFLVESEQMINDPFPNVKILKRSEKLSTNVNLINESYGDYTGHLEKSKRAAREGLGAGAIIYLRKIFENIIIQSAEAATPVIETKKPNGKTKPFIQILEPVKQQLNIIPTEFVENGYTLFGELSDIIHGEYDEEEALLKFDAFYRLVVGVLDNIKNNREIMQAIGTLGWNDGGETGE